MNKKFFTKVMIYFGMVMATIFIGLGASLMFLPYFPFLPNDFKVIMGVFFLVYGIFRLVRLVMQIKEYNDYYENNI